MGLKGKRRGASCLSAPGQGILLADRVWAGVIGLRTRIRSCKFRWPWRFQEELHKLLREQRIPHEIWPRPNPPASANTATFGNKATADHSQASGDDSIPELVGLERNPKWPRFFKDRLPLVRTPERCLLGQADRTARCKSQLGTSLSQFHSEATSPDARKAVQNCPADSGDIGGLAKCWFHTFGEAAGDLMIFKESFKSVLISSP